MTLTLRERDIEDMPHHLSRRPHTKLTLVSLSLLLAASSSCSLTKGKGIAEAAVVKFHDQFNAGKYQEIYEQADDAFLRSLPARMTLLLCSKQLLVRAKVASSLFSTSAETGHCSITTMLILRS